MLDPALASVADPWVRWDWVSSHTDEIGAAARQHVELTVWALALGMLISAPLALAVVRWRHVWPPVLAVTGVVYTIPSLALLALLVPYTGLSRTTALVALVGYTLLILVRNAVAGLDGVPADVREAAQGMGFTRTAQLLKVELPIAVPAIVAGIRIATVTTIGLVTVTALIGQGGVGFLFLAGFRRLFPRETAIVLGVALTTAMAIGFDGVLLLGQRLLAPWTRRRAAA